MKKTILILQNSLLHYRIPLYEKLHDFYDVHVVHTGTTQDLKFHVTVLDRLKFGPFIYLPQLKKTIEDIKPDVVISMFDLYWPQYIFSVPKDAKRLFWGLDNGAIPFSDSIKMTIINWSKTPVIFYSETVAQRWLSRIRVKSFIAQNTVDVGSVTPIGTKQATRNTFINVGALHFRKRNDILITAFSILPDEIKSNSQLIFVGSGVEKQNLVDLAKRLGLADKVVFKGHIDEPEQLNNIYNKAIATISVGQAGLAVSQSIGFGVPFVTHKDAVTGGEIYGVQPGETGDLLSSNLDEAAVVNELCQIMCDRWTAREDAAVFEKCTAFYEKNISMVRMVKSFQTAIEHTLSS